MGRPDRRRPVDPGIRGLVAARRLDRTDPFRTIRSAADPRSAHGKALPPRRHVVAAFRQRSVEEYPSLELPHRAGAMRFALNPGDLELEHERFGPHGWWSAVRDGAEHAVSDAVLEPTVTAEHLYGTKRRDLDAALGRRVTESMRSNSVTVTSFSLGGCSLGRTGDVVAATARARFEIEREQAESAVRRVMARGLACRHVRSRNRISWWGHRRRRPPHPLAQRSARESSDLRIESSRQFGLATQLVQYDTNVASDYAQAIAAEDLEPQTSIRDSLARPEFVPVMDRWEESYRAGDTPVDLLSNTDYLDSQFEEYRTTEAASEQRSQEANTAARSADRYVQNTVVLAIALIFAGITGSFQYRTPRLFLIAVVAAQLVDLPVA